MRTGWTVDEHKALTNPVRTALLRDYGYTAPPGDTYAALVSIREYDGRGSDAVLVTFPFTFVLATYRVDGVADKAGDLEAAIDAACRARLLALRNAAPLTSIVDRVHPL